MQYVKENKEKKEKELEKVLCDKEFETCLYTFF